MAAPTDPTQLLPQRTITDLKSALARLRMARTVHPKHVEPRGKVLPHINCPVCAAQTEFDTLCDRLPRPPKER